MCGEEPTGQSQLGNERVSLHGGQPSSSREASDNFSLNPHLLQSHERPQLRITHQVPDPEKPGEITHNYCLQSLSLGGDLLGSKYASLMAQQVKNPPAMQETQEMRVQSWGQEDTLGEEMATHSSILAWKIPWTEEPDRLQPMELQGVGHN